MKIIKGHYKSWIPANKINEVYYSGGAIRIVMDSGHDRIVADFQHRCAIPVMERLVEWLADDTQDGIYEIEPDEPEDEWEGYTE